MIFSATATAIEIVDCRITVEVFRKIVHASPQIVTDREHTHTRKTINKQLQFFNEYLEIKLSQFKQSPTSTPG